MTGRLVQRPDLTGIAIAYENEELIADELYPYLTVEDRAFEWDKFADSTFFQLLDDEVGPESDSPSVTWQVDTKSGRVIDHFLKSPVPQYDTITKSGAHLNPQQTATALIMGMIALNREARAAKLTFSLDSYLVELRKTLSGTDQWSHEDSNPYKEIRTIKDKMLYEPNIAVIGKEAWTTVSMHPKVVEAVKGTGVKEGVITLKEFADLIEIPKVVVGKARATMELPGFPPQLKRLWGKHFSMHYNNPLSRNTVGSPPTWGMTARLGDRVASTYDDPTMGGRGGVWVKAGESVAEFIVASGCGAFLQNVIA